MLIKGTSITYIISGVILFGIGSYSREFLVEPINPVLDIVLQAVSLAGIVITIWGIIKFFKKTDKPS